MIKTAEVRENAGQLGELLEQVKAGDEVVLTQGSQVVARLLPPVQAVSVSSPEFMIRSFGGRSVLTPSIRHEDIADERIARR